jgi:uncharacterized protein involved in exopolysaccharide biosynthesis
MEQEIDLRPYILALAKRWKAILIFAAVSALIAYLVGRTLSPAHTATADLLLSPVTPQVALEPRYTEREASLVTNQVFQRQALINLANSTTLEERVADEIQLPEYEPGELLARIRIQAESDLLRVVATGSSNAEAVALADVWARTYAQLVAEVYSSDPVIEGRLNEEQTTALEQHAAAQRALEQFYLDGRLVEVEQRVAALEGLFEEALQDDLLSYSDYLTRTREVDLLLEDAQALRAQLIAGGGDNLADLVASVALRARSAAGEQNPIQLQVGSSDQVSISPIDVAELDRLIAALGELRSRLATEASEAAENLGETPNAITSLDAATSARYLDELAHLRGEFAALTSAEQLLLMQRDIALEAVQVLQRKNNEQQIARANPIVSVRFVSTTTAPTELTLVRALSFAAIGVVGGLMLAATLAVLFEVLLPALRRVLASRSLSPTEQKVAERSASTD